MKLMRALIVDPDQAARREIATRLDESGFDAVEAPDGIAALLYASDNSIDLIVTEILTAGVDVLQLLHIVRNGGFGAPPPVIVCSALLHDRTWFANPALSDATLLPRPFTQRRFSSALDAAFPAE